VPTIEEVQQFYDRVGSKHDSQALYEDPAILKLLQNGQFREAHAVFEFGVGTGRLAERLLTDYLPAYCLYRGTDVSTTMVGLTQKRLHGWGTQAAVTLSDGSVKLPVEEGTFDRFVSTYVLEILADNQIDDLLAEVHRVLADDGLFCLVDLSFGESTFQKLVSAAWGWVYRLRPLWVGGCRPICLKKRLSAQRWVVVYHRLISAFGITSEVLVAKPQKRVPGSNE